MGAPHAVEPSGPRAVVCAGLSRREEDKGRDCVTATQHGGGCQHQKGRLWFQQDHHQVGAHSWWAQPSRRRGVRPAAAGSLRLACTCMHELHDPAAAAGHDRATPHVAAHGCSERQGYKGVAGEYEYIADPIHQATRKADQAAVTPFRPVGVPMSGGPGGLPPRATVQPAGMPTVGPEPQDALVKEQILLATPPPPISRAAGHLHAATTAALAPHQACPPPPPHTHTPPPPPPPWAAAGTVTRNMLGRVKGAVGEFEWRPCPDVKPGASAGARPSVPTAAHR